MAFLNVFLIASGALLWAWILFGLGYSLLTRARVRRWLEPDHVLFSALNPGPTSPPTGPMNGIVRGHLALIAPRGCYIRVGSDQRTWEEGKVLTFDDSFEHEVWNHSDWVRIIRVLERFRRAYELSPLSRVHEENQAQTRGHDVALPRERGRKGSR